MVDRTWRRGGAPRAMYTLGALLLAGATLAGCSNGGSGSGDIGVTLMTKTSSNPYFVSMEGAAKAAAKKDNVHLTVAAGKTDSDTDTQIQAIEDAI